MKPAATRGWKCSRTDDSSYQLEALNQEWNKYWVKVITPYSWSSQKVRQLISSDQLSIAKPLKRSKISGYGVFPLIFYKLLLLLSMRYSRRQEHHSILETCTMNNVNFIQVLEKALFIRFSSSGLMLFNFTPSLIKRSSYPPPSASVFRSRFYDCFDSENDLPRGPPPVAVEV